jgi:hypothetical protein
VTTSENIFVVLSNCKVAVPVAVELFVGTSFAPFNTAVKVVILDPVFESLSPQETKLVSKIETVKNRKMFFIE